MIQCEGLVKIYKTAQLEVFALQGLDITIYDGELMAIIGSSGSGKSTLLNMLGGLDRPTAGSLFVNGQDLLKFSSNDFDRYKTETVGFVWQNNARNLIPYLTAVENVEIPMRLTKNNVRKHAMELLSDVGLAHRANFPLTKLSGGEQKRVAVAIALANNPKLLLADEPTGSVDSKTTSQIMELFRKLNKERGLTIVIVTHDLALAKKVDRVLAIRDGKISSEMIRKREEIFQDDENSANSWEQEQSHIEYAVMDRAGRLQLPTSYIESLHLNRTNKVKLTLDENRIILTPPGDEKQEF